jgi:streptogramin lyase
MWCLAITLTCSDCFGTDTPKVVMIHPGQEGRYPVQRLESVTGKPEPLGTLGGYDISELRSPVSVSSMGKVMAQDSNGYLWFVETREDKELRIDTKTLEMTAFQLPAGAAPYAIAIDSNNVHWLTAHGIEMLIESHPEDGYCIAHQPPSKGFLIHINADKETGAIWFSQPGNSQVVRYSAETGFKEFPLPTPQAGPGRLDFDKFHNLWVPELYYSKLAKLNMDTGKWQEWELPTKDALPAYCRVDDDGAVWISEPMADKIAYFKDGTFHEFRIPTEGSVVSTTIRDPQNRIWFTEGGWRGSLGGNKLGILEPETGDIKEFLLPTKNAQPLGLILAKDGTIWFQESAAGKIGRATPRPM